MKMQIEKYSRRIVDFLGSSRFLWIVLGLLAVQSLWIALSFRYPLIYDEVRHVPIIEIFANGFPPFEANQATKYDEYGSLNLATAGYTASFYHYIMAAPYWLVSQFTDVFSYKVIFLRVLNIIMATAGLYLFARLFYRMGIRKIYVNLGLLVFTALPIVPFVAAHVNYDNMIFPLTALFFLVAIRAFEQRKRFWYFTGWLVVLDSVASLVKYTFLPVFAAGLVFIAVWALKKYGLEIFGDLKKIGRVVSKKSLIIWVVCLTVSVSLFSYVYIGNVVRYHTPKPECEKVLGEQRCMNSQIAKRNLEAKRTSSERPLADLPSYVSNWYSNMIHFTVMSGGTLPGNRVVLNAMVPVMKYLVFFGVFVAAGVILYAWRDLKIGRNVYFILVVSSVLVFFVFLDNYSSYRAFHIVYGTQPRYLLTAIPLLIVLAIASFAVIFRKFDIKVKMLLLLLALLVLSQGGGAITHIVRSDPSWYWDNQLVIKTNTAIKKVVNTLVKE